MVSLPLPVPLSFPVDLKGIGPAQIAAWAFAPTPETASDVLPSMWLLCIPGGTYRGLAYFDRQVPGYSPMAYSMVRWLASQGIGSIVIDNPGTGASVFQAQVSGIRLSRQVYADAYQQLVTQIRERLARGRLLPTLAPVDGDRLFLVGVGHSMGGMLATQLQASFGACDALCLLGWASLTLAQLPADQDPSALAAALSTEDDVLPESIRPAVHSFFYSPVVPSALIEADEQDATVLPGGLLEGLQPRSLCEEAARLTCPLYLGFAADCDVTNAPQREVAAYTSVRSLTLFVQSQAHHCANFAPTRFDLWDDIVSWVRVKAVQAKGAGLLPLAFLEEDSAATQPLSS
jgi:pimeloyl-ACP methyl ester carboxylesterase